MINKKFVTCTLPYLNSEPHIGHCFEFLLGDVIATYYRYKLGHENVLFNLGVDEHGQKIAQKAKEEGFNNIYLFCDKYAAIWKKFCHEFGVDYDNFYRTTTDEHKAQVTRFFNEIKDDTYIQTYVGKYCVGCEAFKTSKEIVNNQCNTHKTDLLDLNEENIFFNLQKFATQIQDTLVDKTLSNELYNLFKDEFDLSITRKNVDWGVQAPNGDTFYVWFEALTNYLFAAGYYTDREKFNQLWANSIQICGKDNLKFQSYIFPALCLAANIPQIKEVLVHGIILDENGQKMSKSVGNVINPTDQKEKYGLDPLKYYLVFGLHTFKDSKYSEKDLINLWNSDIVNGLGNTISRVLHIIDKKSVDIDDVYLSEAFKSKLKNEYDEVDVAFTNYDFQKVRFSLMKILAEINTRFNNEEPFKPHCTDFNRILNEFYFQLKNVIPFYKIILKNRGNELDEALENKKKVILFNRL